MTSKHRKTQHTFKYQYDYCVPRQNFHGVGPYIILNKLMVSSLSFMCRNRHRQIFLSFLTLLDATFLKPKCYTLCKYKNVFAHSNGADFWKRRTRITKTMLKPPLASAMDPEKTEIKNVCHLQIIRLCSPRSSIIAAVLHCIHDTILDTVWTFMYSASFLKGVPR